MTERLPDDFTTPASGKWVSADDYDYFVGDVPPSTPQEIGKKMNEKWESLLGVVHPEESSPERVKVLEEAAALITGDRQKDYGPPEVNFQRIADLWNVVLSGKLAEGEKFTPSDVAMAMLQVKAGRGAQGFTRDTAIDLAGYAGLWAELNENDEKKESEIND